MYPIIDRWLPFGYNTPIMPSPELLTKADQISQIFAVENQIYERLDTVWRWQEDGGSFMPPPIKESDADHTLDCRMLAQEVFNTFPLLAQELDPQIVYATILLHDLGEFGRHDILATTKDSMSPQELKQEKKGERESFIKTAWEIGLPYLARTLYDAYEGWEQTPLIVAPDIYAREAVFAQFIDKLQSWRVFAVNTFRLPDHPHVEDVEKVVVNNVGLRKLFYRMRHLYLKSGKKEEMLKLSENVLSWILPDFEGSDRKLAFNALQHIIIAQFTEFYSVDRTPEINTDLSDPLRHLYLTANLPE